MIVIPLPEELPDNNKDESLQLIGDFITGGYILKRAHLGVTATSSGFVFLLTSL